MKLNLITNHKTAKQLSRFWTGVGNPSLANMLRHNSYRFIGFFDLNDEYFCTMALCNCSVKQSPFSRRLGSINLCVQQIDACKRVTGLNDWSRKKKKSERPWSQQQCRREKEIPPCGNTWLYTTWGEEVGKRVREREEKLLGLGLN
jgi:hypothetical protein